jgi:hypothetical protein
MDTYLLQYIRLFKTLFIQLNRNSNEICLLFVLFLFQSISILLIFKTTVHKMGFKSNQHCNTIFTFIKEHILLKIEVAHFLNAKRAVVQHATWQCTHDVFH